MYDPEWVLAVAEKFPAVARGVAKLADEALGSTKFTKALGLARLYVSVHWKLPD